MICGVDEAGKGSVLGPMVVAAVAADSEAVLSGLDVKDSKLLSREKREDLYYAIEKRCRTATIIIPAEEIDAQRKVITMNACVARAHAAVIRKISPSTAYVDACDVNPVRYAQMVREHLGDPSCCIVSEHHADQTYKIVSAASIVAKVIRDREIASLAGTFGEIGSGYPSDPVTIAFLSSYMKEHRRPPDCARKSWKTIDNLIADAEQKTLF
ncbi:MAG: ribonuclease HII [Methanoregula sp.]|nr:MAG: ribonuclease HII [Methanoregula sp.]